jgi:hypothetical protein
MVGQQDSEQREASRGEAEDWKALRGEVGGIAEAAVSQGKHFIESARDQATDFADKRKADVAQSVADLATSLRTSTGSFDERPNIKAVVDSAAEGLEQLADSIRQRSFSQIFADVEGVVRRRPATFGLASLAVGFIAARVIKSTSEDLRDNQADVNQRSPAPPRARG